MKSGPILFEWSFFAIHIRRALYVVVVVGFPTDKSHTRKDIRKRRRERKEREE